MADIEMCEGLQCPLKNTCYRYLATPNEDWQAYSTEIPYDIESGDCDSYWPVKHNYE